MFFVHHGKLKEDITQIPTLENVFICSLFQRICSMLAQIGQHAPGNRSADTTIQLSETNGVCVTL